MALYTAAVTWRANEQKQLLWVVRASLSGILRRRAGRWAAQHQTKSTGLKRNHAVKDGFVCCNVAGTQRSSQQSPMHFLMRNCSSRDGKIAFLKSKSETSNRLWSVNWRFCEVRTIILESDQGVFAPVMKGSLYRLLSNTCVTWVHRFLDLLNGFWFTLPWNFGIRLSYISVPLRPRNQIRRKALDFTRREDFAVGPGSSLSKPYEIYSQWRNEAGLLITSWLKTLLFQEEHAASFCLFTP